MQTGRCSAPIIDWERLGEGDFIGDKGMQKTERVTRILGS